MKSLLFQPGAPFAPPPGCEPGCGAQSVTIKKNNKLYTLKVYRKVSVEEPYLSMVKAIAHSLQNDEPYNAVPPRKDLITALLRNNVTI